jgi:tetratricopeptide (TPR) repeat protein
MQSILRDYCTKYRLRLLELNHHLVVNGDCVDPKFDFQSHDFIFITHVQHFGKLVDAVPYLRYRVIHVIRNPYEIIMSGVRYHQITDETWCNKRLFVADSRGPCGFRRVAAYNVEPDDEAGHHTYREIMNMLSEPSKIEFEIRNHATTFGTINAIHQFLARFANDGNITSIRLEDIATDECIGYVFRFLALHEEFVDAYRSKVRGKAWLGAHVTNESGAYTYEAAFDEKLYALFAAEFGLVARDFGYAPGSPSPEYFVACGKTSSPLPDEVVADATGERSAQSSYDIPALPDHGNANDFFAIGNQLLSLNRLDLCKQAFERALALDNRRAATLGRLGDVCVRLRLFKEAIAYYEQIHEVLETIPAWVYIGLANAFESTGQTEAAISNLKMASSIMPNSDVIRSRLESLEDKAS